MKKITKINAMLLALMILLGLIAPVTAIAQKTDGFFRGGNDNYENRSEGINDNGGIHNDDFGAPLGSGLLILTAAGAGYAIARRRRSRRDASNASNIALLSLALILGMTNCKKNVVETVTPVTNDQASIILNIDNGSKAEVDPPHVNFVENDKILVAHDGKYVGSLTYTEYETGKFRFEGNIDATVATPRQKLYFYFLGNKQNDASLTAGTTTSCTVDISDQTSYPTLPVISFSASKEDYEGAGSYSANLHNKASLIKFGVITQSSSVICITGMNTQVTVNFNDRTVNDGFSYSNPGNIFMKGKDAESATWAIVLPQADLSDAGTAYTGGFSGTWDKSSVDLSTAGQYITGDGSGIYLTANTFEVGKVIGANGKFYSNVSAAEADGTTASGIIAALGDIVDRSSYSYKGLAISLTDAGTECMWFTTDDVTCLSQQITDIGDAITSMNGIASTAALTDGHSGHTHAAASAAKNFATARPDGASTWFLPSMGQWNLIVKGLATKATGHIVSQELTTSNNPTFKADNLNSVITNAGGTGFLAGASPYDTYWSSTESSNANAWVIRFYRGFANYYSKSSDRTVRAVFAF